MFWLITTPGSLSESKKGEVWFYLWPIPQESLSSPIIVIIPWISWISTASVELMTCWWSSDLKSLEREREREVISCIYFHSKYSFTSDDKIIWWRWSNIIIVMTASQPITGDQTWKCFSFIWKHLEDLPFIFDFKRFLSPLISSSHSFKRSFYYCHDSCLKRKSSWFSRQSGNSLWNRDKSCFEVRIQDFDDHLLASLLLFAVMTWRDFIPPNPYVLYSYSIKCSDILLRNHQRFPSIISCSIVPFIVIKCWHFGWLGENLFPLLNKWSVSASDMTLMMIQS